MTGRIKFLAFLPLAFVIGGPTGEKNYTIDAQYVIFTSSGSLDGQPRIQGHFRIREPREGEYSIPSAGGGGGCLIAQDPSNRQVCTGASDCTKFVKAPNGLLYEPAGRHGYCVPPSGALRGAGTCWWKPSYDNCNIGAGPGDHVTPLISPYATWHLLKVPIGTKLSWRVVACLNGIDVDPDGDDKLPPCAEPVHRPKEWLERFGYPRDQPR